MKLLRYFKNYVVVHIYGDHPEKWINIAIRRDIPIWDLNRCEDGSFTLCMPRIDYWRSGKSICGKTGCRSKVLSRCGLLYTLRKGKQRKALMVSLIIACGLICFLSSLVWSVEVIPGDNTTVQDVQHTRNILLDCGLKPGVFLESVDFRGIASHILQSESGLCWAQVRREGTKIYVEIERGTYYEENTAPGSPCDLVADKDFELVKCTVYQGKATCVPGQIVHKGDVVISGLEDNVHASGDVIGRTWYTSKVEVVSEVEQVVETGKTDIVHSLFLFGTYIPLPGKHWLPWHRSSGENSSRTTTLNYWQLPGGFRLPLGIRTTAIKETTLEKVKMDTQSGAEYARMQAGLILDQKIPDDAQILSTKWRLAEDETGAVFYEITAECIENINMKIVDKL